MSSKLIKWSFEVKLLLDEFLIMSTRYYPLYQRGNPQLRVFLPNFWMKLLKSEEPLPPNVALFQTSIEMTKYDVKNYLEKIYKVPVIDVKITIKMGTIRRKMERFIKDDDYKEALVYMPKDYKFEFPEIVPLKKDEKQDDETEKNLQLYKNLKEDYKKSKKQGVPFLPNWFT